VSDKKNNEQNCEYRERAHVITNPPPEGPSRRRAVWLALVGPGYLVMDACAAGG
jgi:hypothetical protein